LFGDAKHMSTHLVVDVGLEFLSSVLFLLLGVCGCLYAYGFSSVELFRGFRWRVEFRQALRWLAPVLVVLSVVAILMQIHDGRASSWSPNERASGNGRISFSVHVGRASPAVPEKVRKKNSKTLEIPKCTHG
jgi:H+/Cl- antiporter ClcA